MPYCRPRTTHRLVSAAGLIAAGLIGAALPAATPRPAGAANPFEAMNAQQVLKEVQAPPFKLQTVEGKPVALEDLKGKVVFFYFWRTW